MLKKPLNMDKVILKGIDRVTWEGIKEQALNKAKEAMIDIEISKAIIMLATKYLAATPSLEATKSKSKDRVVG